MKICRVIKEGTKKEYTYLTNIELKKDDKVVADFGGTKTLLLVTSTGDMTQEEYDSLGYPLKTIEGFADEIEIEAPEDIDIKIEKESLPVIAINFDEIKDYLSDTLTKYKNIVVTEETLSSSKATRKDLTRLKTKIDNYRKDKKKVLSAPIKAFEEQCKDLIELIEKVEKPIKEATDNFDNKAKQEKVTFAKEYIKEMDQTLSEPFRGKLIVKDEYQNVAMTENKIKADINEQVQRLQIQEEQFKVKLESVAEVIAKENETLKTKLNADNYVSDLMRATDSFEIVKKIQAKAEEIRTIENAVKEEPKEEVKPIEVKADPEPVEVINRPVLNHPGPVVSNEESKEIHFANFRVTGKRNEVQAVIDFMTSNAIEFEVINRGSI